MARACRSTVLVVEDEDNDFALLERMLTRSRILNPTCRVNNIRDALCYLKGEGQYQDREKFPFPSLVLLDMHLPDGTGFDALRWLRQHPKLTPPAVVVLTGSDPDAIRRSYSEGANSFLIKPLRLEEFKNMAAAVRGIKLTEIKDGYLLEEG